VDEDRFEFRIEARPELEVTPFRPDDLEIRSSAPTKYRPFCQRGSAGLRAAIPYRRDWEQVTRRVRSMDIVRNLFAAWPSWGGKSPPLPRPSMADLRPMSLRFRPQDGLQDVRLRTRCNSLPRRRHLVWRQRGGHQPSSSPQVEASPAPVRQEEEAVRAHSGLRAATRKNGPVEELKPPVLIVDFQFSGQRGEYGVVYLRRKGGKPEELAPAVVQLLDLQQAELHGGMNVWLVDRIVTSQDEEARHSLQPFIGTRTQGGSLSTCGTRLKVSDPRLPPNAESGRDPAK
jgi:hypothetical protein